MQKPPFKKYFRPIVRLLPGREVSMEKKLSTLFVTVAVAASGAAYGATSASARNASRPMATAVPVQFVAVASSSIANNEADGTADGESLSTEAKVKKPNAQQDAKNVSQRSSLPPTAPRLLSKTRKKSAMSQNAKKPVANATSVARLTENKVVTSLKVTSAISSDTIDVYEKTAQNSPKINLNPISKRVSDSARIQIADYSQKVSNSAAATVKTAPSKTAQENIVTSSTRVANTASPSVPTPSVPTPVAMTTGKRVVLLPRDSARSNETADKRAANVPAISRVQTSSDVILNPTPLPKVEPKLPQRKPANLSSRARDRFLLAQMEADLRRAQGRLDNASETLSQGQKQLMKVSGTLQQAMLEAGNDAKGLNPFVRVAQRYAGTPYVWGGESRNGFDCSGFIIVVMRDLGYRALPHSAAEQFNYGTPIAKPLLKAGDIVFFKNTYKRGVSHVGIYLGRGRFIHAAGTGTGTIVSSLNEAKWILHYAGARRLVSR